MITDARFPVEPWQVRELQLDLELLAQSESVFALSNGHIGVRGNLDEGDPAGLPGTYLNSFYEARPLPYAEAGYGYPESGQTVVNVTDGKLIRLLVDDEPFDMRYGTLVRHERVLDLRSGTLRRDVEWMSPAGTRSGSAPSGWSPSPSGPSWRSATRSRPSTRRSGWWCSRSWSPTRSCPQQSDDPRVAAVLQHPLEPVEHSASGNRSLADPPHPDVAAADGRRRRPPARVRRRARLAHLRPAGLVADHRRTPAGSRPDA